MISKVEIEKQLGKPIVNIPLGLDNLYIRNQIITSEDGKRYFIKYGPKSKRFYCEANGINEIAKSATVRVPRVACCTDSFIITEFIESGIHTKHFFENFGYAFAKMHKESAAEFGFIEDNFIGESIQVNIATGSEKTNWCEFYVNKRLMFQYRMAEKNGYASKSLAKGIFNMEKSLSKILKESEEPPALLHGDLWSGNFMCGADGEAVIIDPAVYYGHREADLAMTMLFGGFPQIFYDSYHTELPLKPGWESRVNIYKLYHVLNHLNIFGRGYLYEAEILANSYICNN